MSTSNSHSFFDTTQSIIYDSLSFIGRLGDGETPSDGDYNLALRTLNRISKSIMVKNDRSPGMKAWKRHQSVLFLSSNTGTYTLSANINESHWCSDFNQVNGGGNNPAGNVIINLTSTAGMANNDALGMILDNNTLQWTTIANVNSSTVVTVNDPLTSVFNQSSIVYNYANTKQSQPPQVLEWSNIRDVNGNDLDIQILTYEEYVALPSKQSVLYTGDPVACYYESHLIGNSGRGKGLLFTDVDAASDLTKYLVLNYVDEIQDWVNPYDEPDFPKEWNSALVYNLGKHLCPSFNMPWSQLQEDLAQQSLALAKSANPKKLAFKFVRRNSGASTWKNPPHR